MRDAEGGWRPDCWPAVPPISRERMGPDPLRHGPVKARCRTRRCSISFRFETECGPALRNYRRVAAFDCGARCNETLIDHFQESFLRSRVDRLMIAASRYRTRRVGSTSVPNFDCNADKD